MSDKISIYDLLATVVPGTLIVCLVPVGLPDLAAFAKDLALPETFAVLGLTALAVFFGNLVQALASVLDPLLNWMWGGRPSERCLAGVLGERYLPKDSADRIRAKFQVLVGPEASDRSLFLYAMQQAESAEGQRVTTFNALFAYHRALLILAAIGLVFAVAVVCGHGPAAWGSSLRWGLLVGNILIVVLFWHRTKQRAYYYVREVLLTAERQVDQKQLGKGTTAETERREAENALT